jgi:secretion/DNA translocation related TadE-like protein
VSRPTGDAGVAGVLVLSLSCVLALVGALGANLAAVAVARQRAAAVADLAALAAAARVLDGPAAACARASRLAADSGGLLASCAVDGDVAVVVAEVRPAGPLGRLGAASARARAGPAR